LTNPWQLFLTSRFVAVAAVRSSALFVELAQKVETSIHTVNGLVIVNQKLVGLFTEALGSASEKREEVGIVGKWRKLVCIMNWLR